MRRKVALLLALLILVSTAPTASASEPYQVTVMSRNLYLGADVGVALDLIPDFPATPIVTGKHANTANSVSRVS